VYDEILKELLVVVWRSGQWILEFQVKDS